MTLNELWKEIDALENSVEEAAVACQMSLDPDLIDSHRRDVEYSRNQIESAFKSLLAQTLTAETENADLKTRIAELESGPLTRTPENDFRAWSAAAAECRLQREIIMNTSRWRDTYLDALQKIAGCDDDVIALANARVAKLETEVSDLRAHLGAIQRTLVSIDNAVEDDLHVKLGCLKDQLTWLVLTEEEEHKAAVARGVAYWVTAFHDAVKDGETLTTKLTDALQMVADRAEQPEKVTIYMGLKTTVDGCIREEYFSTCREAEEFCEDGDDNTKVLEIETYVGSKIHRWSAPG